MSLKRSTFSRIFQFFYHFQNDFIEKDDNFEEELKEIGDLRAKACLRPIADIDGVAACKRYYSQLHFIQQRFKIDDKSDDGPFAFPWIEIYNGVMFTYCSLQFEMASVLYNVGALHTGKVFSKVKLSLVILTTFEFPAKK